MALVGVWHLVVMIVFVYSPADKLLWPSMDDRKLRLLGMDGEGSGSKPSSPSKNIRTVSLIPPPTHPPTHTHAHNLQL